MKSIKLTYLDSEWTTGTDYNTNCEMCQQKAGLANMIPVPTTRVKLEYGQDSSTRYLCKSCLDKGVASGQLTPQNQQPANCPFAM